MLSEHKVHFVWFSAVNACEQGNGGCDQVCTSNGYDGHQCQCFPGYELNSQGKCVGRLTFVKFCEKWKKIKYLIHYDML